MAKKIYDIMPPKAARPSPKLPAKRVRSQRVKKEMIASSRALQSEPSFVPEETQRRFPVREIAIGGTVIVLLLGIYFYNSLAKVEINISPKTEAVSFQENITADTSYENVNVLKKIIPARVVSQEVQISEEFAATGLASNAGTATGTIKVYNKVSPSTPITLKAGTHFLSDSGKYFISLDRIIIPAMQGGNPGSIDVNVEAEESGSAHNIGPSKFSVPKLSGTAYYYNIWAESKDSMSGGYTGDVKKVTKDNLAGAKESVIKRAITEAQETLKATISVDEVLLESDTKDAVIEASADAKEGAVQEKFRQTAKVKVTALVFKKDDVQKLAKLDAESRLSEGRVLRQESLNVTYQPDPENSKDGVYGMVLDVSGSSYYYVDPNSFVSDLPQKNANQIEQIIEGEYGSEISNIGVKFWPFWVGKAPKDTTKIKVNLNFE